MRRAWRERRRGRRGRRGRRSGGVSAWVWSYLEEGACHVAKGGKEGVWPYLKEAARVERGRVWKGVEVVEGCERV